MRHVHHLVIQSTKNSYYCDGYPGALYFYISCYIIQIIIVIRLCLCQLAWKQTHAVVVWMGDMGIGAWHAYALLLCIQLSYKPCSGSKYLLLFVMTAEAARSRQLRPVRRAAAALGAALRGIRTSGSRVGAAAGRRRTSGAAAGRFGGRDRSL